MDFKRMLEYSSGLDKNNNRTWFHETHKEYEKARADFTALCDMTRFAIADCSPELAKDIMFMQPKDWIYRTARDMRYYRDMPPYNPAFRAYISPDRRSRRPIGYYMRICPGTSCFGTGLWCETTAEMNSVREFISENHTELAMLLAESGLTISGEKVKTMPRGWSDANPAAELIKHKEWMLIIDIPDGALTTFDAFDSLVRSTVERMEPIRLFLLRAARGEKTQKQLFEEFYSAGISF